MSSCEVLAESKFTVYTRNMQWMFYSRCRHLYVNVHWKACVWHVMWPHICFHPWRLDCLCNDRGHVSVLIEKYLMRAWNRRNGKVRSELCKTITAGMRAMNGCREQKERERENMPPLGLILSSCCSISSAWHVLEDAESSPSIHSICVLHF